MIFPYRKRLPQEEDFDILLQWRQRKEPPAHASGSSSYKTQLTVEPSIVGFYLAAAACYTGSAGNTSEGSVFKLTL